MSFSNRFLCDFTFQNRTRNLEFSLNSMGKNNIFWLSDWFNIKSLLDTISVPTWLDFGTPNLHFGTQKPPKSCLGSVLGVIVAFLAALESLLERLRLVLGCLGSILDRLGGILGRFGAIWGRLERI